MVKNQSLETEAIDFFNKKISLEELLIRAEIPAEQITDMLAYMTRKKLEREEFLSIKRETQILEQEVEDYKIIF